MTREDTYLTNSIERAASAVGSAWPLHSFVTANPLSGFEDRPFHQAVEEAEGLFGGRGYPHPSVFREAWAVGRIDPDALAAELTAHGFDETPEESLARMEAVDGEATRTGTAAGEGSDPATEAVDCVLSKWLAAFLDQGSAAWPMPERERGFYCAWRRVAPHDGEVPGIDSADELPESPTAAIERVLSDYPQGTWETVFEEQLAALPGWTGFVKRQAESDGPWQSSYPITLTGYLAVRLLLAASLDAPIDPDESDGEASKREGVPRPEAWLTAWEKSHRERLLGQLGEPSAESADEIRPAAQLVFCIDTRSEVIRRHLEASGRYETHGYAGFFGVPMRYRGYDSEVAVDACPPVLDPKHRVSERPVGGDGQKQASHDRWQGAISAGKNVLKGLKTNAATAFSFVESAGPAYGLALTARTLLPGGVYDALHAGDRTPAEHEFCAPALDAGVASNHALPEGLTLEERVEYAQTAFDLMGWSEFARLVVFTGHASETTNNPFGSSLDCGACAGNAGGPNARVLAQICNDERVRAALRERGVDIPEDTVFLAAEHNTTTDEVTLFDREVPESHQEDLQQLRADLDRAQARAAAERTGVEDGARETQRRTADWAETRPEWGLAGNASFVIGPRDLTADADLDGRTFLHSYDWRTDPEGDALAAIVAGPLVVTQWINNQYYFATVDNAVYGSGSKVTQNPVGNVGVYQGNGGDLQTGLPLQSLYADADSPYHQPLRLTAVIHAPIERVTKVLHENEEVTQLLDNGWIGLTVVDPEQEHAPLHYAGDFEWERPRSTAPAETPMEPVPASADD